MTNITLSIPEELLKEFKEKFPEINIAEVARRVIINKVEELEKLEELKLKGKI
jgi:hypothetical protein